MADNTTISSMSGGDTIASDDIGGVKHQRIKIEHGADGSATDVSSASPLPTTPDTGKAEDTAHTTGDKGVMPLAVRKDAPTALAGTDGDYIPLTTDNKGALYIKGTKAEGETYTQGTDNGMLIMGVDPGETSHVPLKVNFETFGLSITGDQLNDASDNSNTGPVKIGGKAKAAAPTDVSADGDRVDAWFLRNGAQATEVTAAGARIGGDATNGLDVDVTRLPALPAGTNNIGDVDVLTLPGIAGDVAHDAADSGSPAKVGGKATNVEPAAVANNDRANFITDLVGKQIVLPYANPENFVSGAITTAMTGTTSTSLVAAPGAGLRNYITTIIVSNAHATVGTDVIIQDGSGGTTLLTIPAAAVYGGAAITLPVPLRQPTANTALFCANVTTGASTKVSAVGYKGV